MTWTDGLWGFWEAEEATGNRLDATGNLRHLVDQYATKQSVITNFTNRQIGASPLGLVSATLQLDYYYKNDISGPWIFLFSGAVNAFAPNTQFTDVFPQSAVDAINAASTVAYRRIGVDVNLGGITSIGNPPVDFYSPALRLNHTEFTHIENVITTTSIWSTYSVNADGYDELAWQSANALGSEVGKVGNCAVFNYTSGLDAELKLEAYPDLSSNAPFTYAFWKKFTGVSSGSAGLIDGELFISFGVSAGLVKIDVQTFNVSVADPVGVTQGDWHLFIVKYDGTTLTLKIDNVVIDSQVGTSNISFPGSYDYVDVFGPSNGGVSRIDQFGIWTRWLDNSEDAILWNGGAGIAYPQPAPPSEPDTIYVSGRTCPLPSLRHGSQYEPVQFGDTNRLAPLPFMFDDFPFIIEWQLQILSELDSMYPVDPTVDTGGLPARPCTPLAAVLLSDAPVGVVEFAPRPIGLVAPSPKPAASIKCFF